MNKFKLKMMVCKIEFYAYLPNIYLFFHLKLRSDPKPEPGPNLFPAERDPGKQISDTHPCNLEYCSVYHVQTTKPPYITLRLYYRIY